MKQALLINLTLILLAGIPQISFGKKRYRYIKREHGVELVTSVVDILNKKQNFNADIEGSYTYNWRGKIEVGPWAHLNMSKSQNLTFNILRGGLLLEYNFIKNRGKRKFIPALGIKLGADKSAQLNWILGVYTDFKYFVGYRTPFVVKLEYVAAMPEKFGSAELKDFHNRGNLSLSTGFSYYFDFY